MKLSDIFLSAIRELDGFDEYAVEIAIKLAESDVVETIEELVDFVNFNIEEGRFPQINAPYEERIIRKAVEKARTEENKKVHLIDSDSDNYPAKLIHSNGNTLATLTYKGNLKNLDGKIIMITGSPTATNNAKYAAKYFGKLFASNGYSILSSLSGMCEQHSVKGCSEAKGKSIFFLPHNIESLTVREKAIIPTEMETGRSTLISVCQASRANDVAIETTNRYLLALADCLIVPQLRLKDNVLKLVKQFLLAEKPVFFIDYEKGGGIEYDYNLGFNSLGVKYLSNDNAVEQVHNAIFN